MSSASLPLDQPRTVVIKHKDHKFTYRFRRITERDWRKYYAGIVSTTEVSKEGQERVFDPNTALQQLVEDTLESVDGYTAPDGMSVTDLKDWKLKLPLKHKITVGFTLADAGADPRDDAALIADVVEISISAAWSADENGNMTKYRGLLHRFQHPSIEQLRRYNRESSRAIVVGGSRSGKTIWPGRHEILAKFYDELVTSVDGYSFKGQPITNDVELIKREMDTQHKVAAALALFSGGEDVEVATAE